MKIVRRWKLNNVIYIFLFNFLDSTAELKKYRGLILAFSLPKSSYATMALREILHRNESKLQTHHQQEEQSLSNQEEEEEEVIEDEILWYSVFKWWINFDFFFLSPAKAYNCS